MGILKRLLQKLSLFPGILGLVSSVFCWQRFCQIYLRLFCKR